MDRDAREPSGKLRSTLELAKMFVGFHVRILNDVLGLGVVSENRARRPVKALIVTAHDELKELYFTSANPVYYVFVAPLFQSCAFQNCGRLHTCPRSIE